MRKQASPPRRSCDTYLPHEITHVLCFDELGPGGGYKLVPQCFLPAGSPIALAKMGAGGPRKGGAGHARSTGADYRTSSVTVDGVAVGIRP
jgi:hypothetical protein